MLNNMNLTREAWLHAAVDVLRDRFASVGMSLPEALHISVGFGYGAKRESSQILGQCWATEASEDGVNHIFISPELDDTARVLDVLIHELIHAADNCKSGHRGAFAEAATRLGLEGPMTATHASIGLAAEMLCLSETLGDYPHGKLNASVLTRTKAPVDPSGKPLPKVHSGPGKQGTRMLKVVCPADGYTVRTTAKWLAMGAPSCPCGEVMVSA